MSGLEGVRELGVSLGFGIVEPAGEQCEYCAARPGAPQRCIMDGAHHRHGMTHVREGDALPLRWLCSTCWHEAVRLELREHGTLKVPYRD